MAPSAQGATMMNKGTAIVGFFLCFMVGMCLQYSLDRRAGVSIGPTDEAVAKLDAPDQSGAAVPVTGKEPSWGNPTAPVTIVEFSEFQ